MNSTIRKEFKFMSISNEPFKSEGTYEKNNNKTEIVINFEKEYMTIRFKYILENLNYIESIGFYNSESGNEGFEGPLKITKINGLQVKINRA